MFGGRVIAGQLDFLLGSSLDGRRFFVGSEGDGQRWRELLAVLETQCAADAALDQAIDGARFAFGLFERCVVGNEAARLVPSTIAATAMAVDSSTNLAGAVPV